MTQDARFVETANFVAIARYERKLFARVTLRGDSSLYLWVLGRQSRFFYGDQDLAGEDSITFNYTQQLVGDELPHLSIHQSGQIHIRNARPGEPGFQQAGPLRVRPLKDWRGEHLATVQSDTIFALQPFEGPLIENESRRDFRLDVGKAKCARLLVYANGLEPRFTCDPRPMIRMMNARGGHPI